MPAPAAWNAARTVTAPPANSPKSRSVLASLAAPAHDSVPGCCRVRAGSGARQPKSWGTLVADWRGPRHGKALASHVHASRASKAPSRCPLLCSTVMRPHRSAPTAVACRRWEPTSQGCAITLVRDPTDAGRSRGLIVGFGVLTQWPRSRQTRRTRYESPIYALPRSCPQYPPCLRHALDGRSLLCAAAKIPVASPDYQVLHLCVGAETHTRSCRPESRCRSSAGWSRGLRRAPRSWMTHDVCMHALLMGQKRAAEQGGRRRMHAMHACVANRGARPWRRRRWRRRPWGADQADPPCPHRRRPQTTASDRIGAARRCSCGILQY